MFTRARLVWAGLQAAIERLRREPLRDFNGRHPTDPHAPGQERFNR